MSTGLSDQDFAELFLGENTVDTDNLLVIVDQVEAWLSRVDMRHRSAWSIGWIIAKLAKASAPTAPEVDRQWAQSNLEGYGDQPNPADMSMSECAQWRSTQGIGRSHSYSGTLEFLGGS